MIYIGIDQTGAVNQKGNPSALPTCMISGSRTSLFYLPAFNSGALKQSVPNIDLSDTLICIDCVIGLPKKIKIPWRKVIQETLAVEGYGRKPALEYFQRLGGGDRPSRNIETQCNANSVFQEHPFQKNIQTGTFRFWKEMAQDPGWFCTPMIPKEMGRRRTPVYEGYPSLSWKLLFQVKSRQPKNLGRLLRLHHPKVQWSRLQQTLVNRDANLADALVLALTAKTLFDANSHAPNPEGWILGASHLP